MEEFPHVSVHQNKSMLLAFAPDLGLFPEDPVKKKKKKVLNGVCVDAQAELRKVGKKKIMISATNSFQGVAQVAMTQSELEKDSVQPTRGGNFHGLL